MTLWDRSCQKSQTYPAILTAGLICGVGPRPFVGPTPFLPETYPICARDLPHKDPYDAVKPAVKSPSSPCVHRDPPSDGQAAVFRPCVHRKGCSRGRALVFCPRVHREGSFRGRSAVFCPRVHPETVSDGQVFDIGVFSHSLIHAGAEGFSSAGSRSPPELLLSDGRKPVPSPSSAPLPSASGKKNF